MYRTYSEIQKLDHNFSLKMSQNFSLSESSRLTPEVSQCCLVLILLSTILDLHHCCLDVAGSSMLI